MFHTQLCHTPSFTNNFVTHTQLCHAPSFTHNFVTHHLAQTWWHPPSFQVAGVALGDIHHPFTWQSWHLETSTCVWRGRRGTSCTWWRAWSPLVAGDAAALCVADVALGAIHLRFTWQAWHLETSTCVWRGRRLGRRWSPVTPRHFAWQAWH